MFEVLDLTIMIQNDHTCDNSEFLNGDLEELSPFKLQIFQDNDTYAFANSTSEECYFPIDFNIITATYE